MRSDSSELRAKSFPRLLVAAKGGDGLALGELLAWYTNYLSALAATQLDRRLAPRMNPSDVVQDAMLAAHRDFADFRGGSQGELLCWLRRILINTLHRAFDAHVKAGRRDIRREVSIGQAARRLDESAFSLAAALPAKDPSPSEAVQAKERAVALADQLASLRPRYRDVLVFRVVHGLSFEEIAARMGRSNGAVRMLWLRALESFRAAGATGEDA